MKISCIIVSYNSEHYLDGCLKSLFSLDISSSFLEIIVIDNNSSDNSLSLLNNYKDKKIKIIDNQKNIGFGAACNKASWAAGGDILFFLNPDTIVEENIFSAMVESFKDQKIGIISPYVVDQTGSPEVNFCGFFPTFLRVIFKKISLDNLKNKKLTVDWVSGAALAIRRNLFIDLKGFDENFFMYFEDIDLCYRAKQRGYKSVILPEVRVMHHRGKSLVNGSKRKEYYYSSQDVYFKKYLVKPAFWILRTMRRLALKFGML